MAASKICLILVLCLFNYGQCGTINDTKTLLRDLLADYNINVRPVADQSDSVNVEIQAYIKSIQEFDEVNGDFSFVGALYVTWKDVNMKWNPALYGGIWYTTVLYSNVWIPELVLLSPAEDVDALGKKWNKIRFYADGSASWLPVDLIESTCAVNVRNYPFDTQACETSFNSLGYTENEVKLWPRKDEVDFSIYQENAMWTITRSKVTQGKTGTDSQLDFVLFLDRKPSFVIINVILPIMFLSMLNVIVFLLIPESGERVSYAITVLLSIAVFMTIVSDLLPQSSDPVPIISYKLMIDMILSSLIVLVTVVNLKWYYIEDTVPVPSWLQSFYRILTCSRRRSSQIDPASNNRLIKTAPEKHEKTDGAKKIVVEPIDSDRLESQLGRLVAELNEHEKITWRKISKLVDRIALVMFTAASIGSFAIFLAITAMGPT